MKYYPDRWIVIKITSPEYGTVEKVLAGWYGGYLGSDSWKLNSGNKRTAEYEDRFEFTGHSGSVYVCYKSRYGVSNLTASMLEYFKQEVPIEVVNKYDVR